MLLGKNQKKFVAALRAPRLKQCHDGYLHTDSAGKPVPCELAACYCTLGLALDALDLHETRSSKLLTELCLTNLTAIKLVEMNDDEKLTFAQIADKIEENPADFFTESK